MSRPVSREAAETGQPQSVSPHNSNQPALFEFGTGFLPPETDAQKGPRGDVSKQRPEIGDHDTREMAAKSGLLAYRLRNLSFGRLLEPGTR